MIRDEVIGPAAAERPATGVRFGIRSGAVGGYVILALLALIYLIPLLFVLQVSLMSSRQFALNAASFPSPIMWSNFPDAWVKGAFGGYYLNTLIYTFTVVFGTLAISALSAFPLARGNVRGSNGFYMLSQSGILIPDGIMSQLFDM